MTQNRQNDKKNQESNQGFASMDSERQREIASAGGKAAHASGNAHEFSSEEARKAGQKGGSVSQRSEVSSKNNYETDEETRNASGSRDQQSSQNTKSAPSNKKDDSY